jgi:hypothetical protein
MKTPELDDMPKALRILAKQIQAPDHIPATCLKDAAAMIESLRIAVADAIRRPLGVIPDSATWITTKELDEAEKRRKPHAH